MKGSVVRQVLPEVPAKILQTVQGHVNAAIRVDVDPQGNVVLAKIDSQGPSRYFANQALQAAQKWKFAPAQRDGHPAASEWLLQFQFDDSQATVTSLAVGP